MMKKLTSLLAAGAAVLGLSAVIAPQGAFAAVGPGEDREQSAPAAGWWTYSGLTAGQIASTLSTNAARLTDLRLDPATGTYAVSEVANSGAFGAAWWYYFGQSPTQVLALAQANNARPTVMDCYQSGTKCNVVMIANSGANAETYQVWQGTPAFIASKVDPTQYRVVSFSRVQGTPNYTAVLGANTGSDAVNWHYYAGQSLSAITSAANANGERVVDLDENNDTGTYNAVTYADGIRGETLVGSSLGALNQNAAEHGERIFDVTPFHAGPATLYAAVSMRNTDDLTEDLYGILDDAVDSGAFGFQLEQVGGPALTGIAPAKQFEPASALKVLFHYVAIRAEQAGTVDDNTPITYHYNPSDPSNGGICPDSYAATRTTTLKNADTLMMGKSDNRMTRGILEAFGKSAMLSQAAALGMTGTTINHNIGCPTAATHNTTTLNDLAKVYEAFQTGADITVAKWRTQFKQRMLNEVNYPSAVDSLCVLVHQEAALLNKSDALASRFCGKITWLAKGGSYQYGGSYPAQISVAGGSLTGLPFKNARGEVVSHAYVYGDFVDNATVADAAQNMEISSARSTVYAEAMRPQILAALQTW